MVSRRRRRCRRSAINSAAAAAAAVCCWFFMGIQILSLGKTIGVRAFTAYASPSASSSLLKRQSRNCLFPVVHSPLSTTCTLCARSSSSTSSRDDQPLSPGPASKIVLKSVHETFLDEILPKLLTPNDDKDNNNNTHTQADDLQSRPLMVVTMVLGVSGGCDSVAMLHALNHFVILQQQQQREGNKSEEIVPKIHWNLHIAHFDHQQRGEDSDGDRHFVQSLCRDMRLPFHCYYWDDHHNQQQNTTTKPLSFSQDAARQWRRSCMRQLLWDEMLTMAQRQANENRNKNDHEQQTPHAGLLLTAHHKDDSEETLLLKLLRGVHLTRISGLPVLQRDDSRPATETTPNAGMPTIYWARPLIHLRKTTVQSFLHENQCAWREDSSNRSDKYRRNRVRNELVPLLRDILGGGGDGNDSDGSAPLEQRLAHAQAQSRELRDDLEPRATQYLAKHTIAITKDGNHHSDPQLPGLFLLPSNRQQNTASVPPSMHFDLVAKEALHMWIVQQTNGSLFVSYEQLQRLLTQLQDFPRRLQWRLNLGHRWDVQREGKTLRMLRITNERDEQKEHAFSSPEVPATLLEWSPVPNLELEENDNGVGSASNRTIVLRICGKPAGADKLRFYQTVVGNSMFTITPSWRPNSKPIKISSFLRGQNVPLHLRKQAPVVTVALSGQEDNSSDDDESRSLVAVYVSSKDKWMVDARFADDAAPQDHTNLTNKDRIAVRLVDDNERAAMGATFVD